MVHSKEIGEAGDWRGGLEQAIEEDWVILQAVGSIAIRFGFRKTTCPQYIIPPQFVSSFFRPYMCLNKPSFHLFLVTPLTCDYFDTISL